MTEAVKVAISSDFFSAFSKLPPNQQSKASKFITNFQKNPTAPGFNYEKINDAYDPNMRSVRIDQAYRGIILKPKKGNVFILLWIDHHDDAYAWARTRRCMINPETGAIQVFEAEEPEVERQGECENLSDTQHNQVQLPGVFDELKDKELISLGVPEALLPMIRNVHHDSELDAIENRLPVEAYEGLFMYLAGSRYDEIINEREQALVADVDTHDFFAALERLASQSRFMVVDDELELQAMLNAPLEKWRVFLHPSQRKLVQGTKNGSFRILGGAGTGKTVVAIHRAKWLAENFADENHKVLFTTFTKNLAIDIKNNLASICTPDLMEKIEVINLDRWVSQFLRQRNYDYTVIYDNQGRQYWSKALDLMSAALHLPDAFYREEWQKVIQPQSIENVDQYKRASRIGRGTRLNRADRLKVWPVFEEYRNLLIQNKKKELDDAYRDVAALLENNPQALPYCSVVVDEAQDMSTQAFNVIRKIVPEGVNDLFIAGDGHQRIYGKNKVVLSYCKINIRGRARKLRINYRTTEEIRNRAVRLLEGFSIDDLDGGEDTNTGYKSLTHGNPPQVEHFESAEQQSDFISAYLKNKPSDSLSNICIVARTKNERDSIESSLNSHGIKTYRITAEKVDDTQTDAVKLATMHRVKGLEFDEVFLASINDGLVPLSLAVDGKGDVVEERQAELEERALLYVALTRARKEVFVLSYGVASKFIDDSFNS
jgi:superfamily I DNA/RNA helicase/mRNA-degrading endonuclease RelE of RelBE toxin-antitoxin system